MREMAYNEKLTSRIRESLANIRNVEERKMFRGVTFMVNGKMSISVGDNEIMFRVDPSKHDELIKLRGCRTMTIKDREYRGYVMVNEFVIKTKNELDYWIRLALEYNRRAAASRKRKKRPGTAA